MISLFSVFDDVDDADGTRRTQATWQASAPRKLPERTVHPSKARKSKNIIFQALSIVVPQILMNTVTIIKHGNPRISNIDPPTRCARQLPTTRSNSLVPRLVIQYSLSTLYRGEKGRCRPAVRKISPPLWPVAPGRGSRRPLGSHARCGTFGGRGRCFSRRRGPV